MIEGGPDQSSEITNTYTYDAYGKLTASTGTLANPFRYTGREFDSETGIYEYRARYYDQTVGRFVSEDPIQFNGGINFFAYVVNNPINKSDPEGLAPGGTIMCPCVKEAGLIRGIACVYGCTCPDGTKKITIVKCRLTDPYANQLCPATYSISVFAGSVVNANTPAPGFCGPIKCQ